MNSNSTLHLRVHRAQLGYLRSNNLQQSSSAINHLFHIALRSSFSRVFFYANEQKGHERFWVGPVPSGRDIYDHVMSKNIMFGSLWLLNYTSFNDGDFIVNSISR